LTVHRYQSMTRSFPLGAHQEKPVRPDFDISSVAGRKIDRPLKLTFSFLNSSNSVIFFDSTSK
jgi:hypothetical protein